MALLWDYRFDLLAGLGWTVKLSLLSAVLAFVLAVIAGTARTSSIKPLAYLVGAYIEFFRGTSALAQLFWLFFVLPHFGVSMTPVQCSVIGLGLCFGAYGAEIVHTCIRAVPKTQLDAAAALNLSWFQTMRIVVWPEAIIMMMPMLGNLLIELIKATSLVSLITIPDLTFQAKSIISKTYQSRDVLLLTLLMYLVLCLTASAGMRRLERKLTRARSTSQKSLT